MYLCIMYLCKQDVRRLNRHMALDIDSRYDELTDLSPPPGAN